MVKKENKQEELFGEVEEVITCGEWLDCWLVKLSLCRKASSVAIYQRTLDKYLLPAFGACQLTELTEAVIYKAINEWATNYVRPTVIFNNLSVLKRALKAAVNEGLLIDNPCATVKWTVSA